MGSTDTVLDELGNLIERLSFDAFGKRRDAGSWTVPGTAIVPLSTNRGYTGHEHLDGVGLIHMNGRIYDPQLGRFLTADPLIQAPRNSQSLNRYSYVVNNPLTLTDPSGYSFMKKYGHVVVGTLFMFIPGGQGLGMAMVQGFMASFAMSRGDVKSAVVGAISAGMFNAVGTTIGHRVPAGSAKHLQKILAHGVVGGAASRAMGRSFREGFMSAAAAQAFAPYIDNIGGKPGTDLWKLPGYRAQRIALAAMVGGTTAAMTGGKFANGAVTGAFSRAWNDEMEASEDRPTFPDMDANYPKDADGNDMPGRDVFKIVGGKVQALAQVNNWENACALRVSIALNESGVSIPYIPGSTFKGADGQNYFLGASKLDEWLTSMYGQPDIVATSNFSSALEGTRGIYVMRPVSIGKFGASGHATLYNGSDCVGGHCYFNATGGTASVKLWKLN